MTEAFDSPANIKQHKAKKRRQQEHEAKDHDKSDSSSAKTQESDKKEYDKEFGSWQPAAPFHQPFYVFPKVGDVVCFPGWLLHFVPSHVQSKVNRVAIPLN